MTDTFAYFSLAGLIALLMFTAGMVIGHANGYVKGIRSGREIERGNKYRVDD